jgi:4-carboxymuconolactone decarboxylase
MKRLKTLSVLALLLTWLVPLSNAQQNMSGTQTLNAKEQSIILISSYTAKGDLIQLQNALTNGLDAGLTISEIREVLIHLYAYCGFPRSLQGINSFMAILEARKAKGITDKAGKEATAVKNGGSKYAHGKKVLEALTGQPEKQPKTGYAAFSPVIDTFLKEHLFADIFGRDILSYSEREIATLAALISLGGVEPMLQGHLRIALHLGITESKLGEMLSLIETKVGKEESDAARQVLAAVTGSDPRQKATDTTDGDKMLFTKGVKAPAVNFTGTVWVNMLVQAQGGLDCSVGVVTFEPGARTNWHSHPGGQVLLVTEGKGYYQEKGQPKRVIQKGDIVKCLPGVTHWHGALPGSKLTHIAIAPDAEKGNTVWLQQVTDEEYNGKR